MLKKLEYLLNVSIRYLILYYVCYTNITKIKCVTLEFFGIPQVSKYLLNAFDNHKIIMAIGQVSDSQLFLYLAILCRNTSKACVYT